MANHVKGQIKAIDQIEKRVGVMIKYLEAVLKGELKGDNDVLRRISAMVVRLEKRELNGDKQEEDVAGILCGMIEAVSGLFALVTKNNSMIR